MSNNNSKSTDLFVKVFFFSKSVKFKLIINLDENIQTKSSTQYSVILTYISDIQHFELF